MIIKLQVTSQYFVSFEEIYNIYDKIYNILKVRRRKSGSVNLSSFPADFITLSADLCLGLKALKLTKLRMSAEFHFLVQLLELTVYGSFFKGVDD